MLIEKANSEESRESVDVQPCRRRGKRDLCRKGQDPAEVADTTAGEAEEVAEPSVCI